jgi:DNA repair exonuclease SbcCD ATPase subunit
MDEADSLPHRRTAAITANVLKEYKEMISNTTADLEEHLENIDNRLRTISVQGTGISDGDTAERQQIQEERNSTQQCLDICNKVLIQLDQAQPNAFIDFSSTYHPPAVTTLGGLTSAQQLTANTFRACREKLIDTTTYLERQLQDINNRLKRFSMLPTNISDKQAAEQERLQEERDAIKQGLNICAEASRQANHEHNNVYEDISLIDDSQQVIISTIGALITARRVSGGSRSIQVFGQMSDESFQLLSRNIGTEKVIERQPGVGPEFEGRYGMGVKLSGQNVKGVGTTPK